MDLEEFVTPSGYKAHLKKDLSYGEYVEIQKILMASMKIDIDSKKVQEFSATAIFESNKKAIEFIVKKLQYPDGKESINIAQSVYDMPRSDGVLLLEKINSITNANQIDEKKGGVLQNTPSSPTTPRTDKN